MWSVEWQDFRWHSFGMRKPEVKIETFHDEAAARARRDELKSQGMVATMRPLVIRQKGLQTALKNQRGDRFNRTWRLHQ